MSLPEHNRSTYNHDNDRTKEAKDANAKYLRDKTTNNRLIASSKVSKTSGACPNPSLTCGVSESYEYWGCRGKACRKAQKDYRQGLRLQRQLRS